MGLRILHTEWSEGWGGQEIRILGECLAFREKGYEMFIACQPNSPLEREAKKAGIRTAPLKMRTGIDALAMYQCMNILRTFQIDLLHTHSSVDSWCCSIAAKLSGVPVVRSRHLSASIDAGPLSRFLYMRLADRVITSGTTIRRTMIRENRFLPGKIIAIPAGVDEKKFSPQGDGRDIRKEFGFTSGDFLVGCVAILRTWKGHRFLIKAVQDLIQEIPHIKLLIVGNGPHEESIRDLVREGASQSYIVLTGFRQDIPDLLRAMDCFVLPSIKNEATSQVIPQAMAVGVPVVATNAGGISEVVTDRVTGLLVPPEDSDSLAKAIKWVCENRGPAREMAQRGRRYALEHLTFSKMIDDTEKVYLSLLNSQYSPQRRKGRKE